jgi:hypothetical protein
MMLQSHVIQVKRNTICPFPCKRSEFAWTFNHSLPQVLAKNKKRIMGLCKLKRGKKGKKWYSAPSNKRNEQK